MRPLDKVLNWLFPDKEYEALKREEWLKAHTFIQNEKVEVCPHGEFFGHGRIVSRKTVYDAYSIDHYYEVELEAGIIKTYLNSELKKPTQDDKEKS